MLKTLFISTNNLTIAWIVSATFILYTVIMFDLGLNQMVEELNNIF
jgi:hypothetical protein